MENEKKDSTLLSQQQIESALFQAGYDMNKATAILSVRHHTSHTEVRIQILDYYRAREKKSW